MLDRKAIVVLASDFQDSDFDKPLRITNQKHDLVSIIVNDEHEETLPNLGLIPFRDSESGQEILIDTSSKKVRESYRKKRSMNRQVLSDKLLKMKIDSVEVSTNQSYVQPLMNFFLRRVNRY